MHRMWGSKRQDAPPTGMLLSASVAILNGRIGYAAQAVTCPFQSLLVRPRFNSFLVQIRQVSRYQMVGLVVIIEVDRRQLVVH
jgi:hypothetical protein